LTAEVKAARKPRARARRKKPPDFASFLIEVERWEWTFSFALTDEERPSDPYSDYRYLHVFGTTRYPAKPPDMPAEIIFMPNSDLDKANRHDLKPRGVGNLRKWGGKLTAHFSIPQDALAPLLVLLTANRIRSISAYGSAMQRGRSLLKSFDISTEIDIEQHRESSEA
jgi:hypothetical protein